MAFQQENSIFIKPDKEVLKLRLAADSRIKYLPTPGRTILEIKNLLKTKPSIDRALVFAAMTPPLQYWLAESELDFPIFIHGGSCGLETQTVLIDGKQICNKGILDILAEGKEGTDNYFYGYNIETTDALLGNRIQERLSVVLEKARLHSRCFLQAAELTETPESWDSFPLVLLYNPGFLYQDSLDPLRVSLIEGHEAYAILNAIILDRPNF